MSSNYPPGPREVPPDLTAPSRAYERHARIAMAGLLLFIALYFGLLAWFSWTAYRLWIHENFVLAVANGFFAVFLAKALIFFKRSEQQTQVELTAADEPELFAFLQRLVEEAGAPAPHRVFLAHDVNAAVFYDLSLLNLIWPTRKNLLIGVGLINALSLGELKAVLAHEFGHFAQRSMAVGRWVYVAQQVAHQIVAKRDALDKLLMFISRIDLRVAWIGWIMRLIVWSLRSTLEITFRMVVLAERALSREMEFQADLVAVSLTGSDALVHALHRLGAADEALGEAVSAALGEAGRGRAVEDLYALQTRTLERMRTILDDPNYGVAPERPADRRAEHRVFERQSAQPPRMWATHPPNHEREDNVKRRYVDCEIDQRSAWVLFRDPPAIRRRMTKHVLELVGAPVHEFEQLDANESVGAINRRFDRQYFEPRYRGAYLGRSCVREAETTADLFEKAGVAIDFKQLYPESLRRELGRWKNTMVEQATLEGLRDGRLKSPDGVIRHRGQAIKFRDIPNALEQVHADCKQARAQLAAHDRLCRSMHWAAARQLGQDWADYHYSLVALLHWADHSEANLRDAQAHLANVVAVVTADERITDAERRRTIHSAEDVHNGLLELHEHARRIVLPEALTEELGVASVTEMLDQPYTNPPPDEQNLGDWLGAIDGWLSAALGVLDALERLTLQCLLELEEQLEAWVIAGVQPGPAPMIAEVPHAYRVLTPGKERELQTKLSLWDRFYLAQGWLPATARTLIALTIVALVLYSGL